MITAYIRLSQSKNKKTNDDTHKRVFTYTCTYFVFFSKLIKPDARDAENEYARIIMIARDQPVRGGWLPYMHFIIVYKGARDRPFYMKKKIMNIFRRIFILSRRIIIPFNVPVFILLERA